MQAKGSSSSRKNNSKSTRSSSKMGALGSIGKAISEAFVTSYVLAYS
jgi:hypothetical protein